MHEAMAKEAAEAIFEGVKDAATKPAWAKGVAFARSAELSLARRDGEDWHFHVTAPASGVTYSCMVNPSEEDWQCSCSEADDPCRHIVALVIGLHQAEGQIAAPQTTTLKVGYFFTATSDPSGQRLHCDRAFFDPETMAIHSWLNQSLKVSASRPDQANHVESADLDLDPWLCHLGLSTEAGEPIPATSMTSIFAILAVHQLPAFWQAKPVQLHKEPYPEMITLTDHGDGVAVKLGQSTKGGVLRFSNGAVYGEGTGLWLPSASATAELPPEASWLRSGRVFKSYELGYLGSEVLPALAARFTWLNHSRNLPSLVKEQPRPAFYCEAEGDTLSVTPKLVYGDPPVAKVEQKALVLIGSECPERLRNEEYALTDSMGRKLAMVPGDTVQFKGKKAQAMASTIKSFVHSHRGLLFSRHPQTGRWRQDNLGGVRSADSGLSTSSGLSAGSGLSTGSGLSAGSGLSTGSGLSAGSGLHQFENHGTVVPHISLGATDFSLSFKLDGKAEREVSAEQVFRAFREGESMISLKGGGFANLPSDWLAQYGPMLARLWYAKQHGKDDDKKQQSLPQALPKSLWPSYSAMAAALDGSFTPSDKVQKLSRELKGKAPEASLPKGIKASLRPYQQEGYNWLKLRQAQQLGAILADDMGLGKTLQTICILPNSAKPSLVICPTSVLFNWQQEIARFRPQLSCLLYHGPQRTLDLSPKSHQVILTSYGTLRRDQAKLSKVDWSMVVVDEAQTIKNPSSQVSAAAYSLTADFKLALTGTPIENSLMDLWSQFHFLLPGFLGDHKPFAASLGSAGEAAQVEAIKEQIAPYILRRTKKQVLTDLPEKIESILHYELVGEEREHYDALYAASQPKVQDLILAGGKLEILEIILRLRQACCHPSLGMGKAIASEAKAPSGKLRPLLAKLAEIRAAGGGKSLIFSQWTQFLDIIERQFIDQGIRYCRLDGKTRDRSQVVQSFQEDEAIEVMLISLKAGSTGINLTAAENVFIMDPWWNPAIENQAADRAYRMGQKKTVQVFRLVAVDTIEENIVMLKDAKQRLADAAIASDTEHSDSSAESQGHDGSLPELASLFT